MLREWRLSTQRQIWLTRWSCALIFIVCRSNCRNTSGFIVIASILDTHIRSSIWLPALLRCDWMPLITANALNLHWFCGMNYVLAESQSSHTKSKMLQWCIQRVCPRGILYISVWHRPKHRFNWCIFNWKYFSKNKLSRFALSNNEYRINSPTMKAIDWSNSMLFFLIIISNVLL